ncbi:MAG TPA: GGDEF domain-containing protein [Polyangia bacterium]|nr:GGDEF domain-containing protein [Polyangia bacterium]
MARAVDNREITQNTDLLSDRRTPQRRSEKSCLVVLAGSSFGEMFQVAVGRTVIGRGEGAAVRILDDGISREHAVIESDGNQAVLVDLKSTNGTFCNGLKISRHQLADGDKIAIGANTILKFTYQDELEAHFQKQLYQSALRDGLTNSFNRRYFLDRLNSELKFAKRHQTSLALLFLDVDHFKRVNDNYGHPAGDRVLAEISARISGMLRNEDVFARYGGEEFAVVCRGIDLAGAEALATRILSAVREMRIEHAGRTILVTVSIGVAIAPGPSDVHALIAAADAAMYEAKRQGRDRIASHKAPTQAVKR